MIEMITSMFASWKKVVSYNSDFVYSKIGETIALRM